LLLSALFYLGAAIGLSVFRVVAPAARFARQAPIIRADWPLLAGVVFIGGFAGPVLMLIGLQSVSGIAGSLLLNLEAVFTMLIATAFFGEHLGRGEALAGGVVVVGAVLLGFHPGELAGGSVGVAAIAGACLCGGIDNNLTQRLSLRDVTAIVRFKSAGAGTISLVLALALGQRLPRPSIIVMALAVGSLSYGMSLVFSVYSLRYVGAAREAAFFAVAPFAGALLAVPLLNQLPMPGDWAAGAAMAFGVVFLFRARHGHTHRHESLTHEHEHIHDVHHRHGHQGDAIEPHSHLHQHEPLEHDHAHVSDHHHRHPHK
jgi:drug/metabolite transporter (DMT)-like permease